LPKGTKRSGINVREGGRQIHFYLSAEQSARLDAVLGRVPYAISISSLGERGLDLALDELEKAFPVQVEE
jgi:hypothetical protein